MRRFDLRSLHYDDASEAWRRLPVEVAPFTFGGMTYEVVDDVVDLDLTVARVGSNLTLTASFQTALQGPCQRCLDEAVIEIDAQGVDFVHNGDSEVDPDDEESGYVESHSLDLDRWVRDLIAEALPGKLLCSDECLGLCPTCGRNLNESPEHGHSGG